MNRIELSLQEHQNILFEILFMVDDFCKENKIKYFLAGGTLLGAVRHKGIIPWDDDIDLGMERSEYNKFIDLFSHNTPQGYFLYTCANTSWYNCPFVKVAKENTIFEEDNNRFPNGICINIDIMPYDGCPGNLKEAVAYFTDYRNKVENLIVAWYTDPDLAFHGWKSKLYYYTHRFQFVKKRLFLKLYKEAELYKIQDCEYCACITWGLYGEGEVQRKECFTNTEYKQFGSRTFPVPSGWHELLTGLYGNYMTPPPPEKRIGHIKGKSYIITNNNKE